MSHVSFKHVTTQTQLLQFLPLLSSSNGLKHYDKCQSSTLRKLYILQLDKLQIPSFSPTKTNLDGSWLVGRSFGCLYADISRFSLTSLSSRVFPGLSQDILGLYHDFLMTFTWLSLDFSNTFSWLTQDFLRTFSGLSQYFLRTFPWVSLDFPMTFSGLSQDFLQILSWLSPDFLRTFSGLF